MDTAAWWMLGVLLGIAYLLHLTPRLTRPEVFFGVTVRSDFRDSPAGLRLTRVFRVLVWGVTAAVVAAAIAGWRPNPGAIVLGAFLGWYAVNRMTRRFAVQPSAKREVSLDAVEPRVPGSWLARLGPFLMLGGVAFYLYQNYATLPDPYPVHWNFQGEADRFIAKSIKTVFRPVVVGLAVCGAIAISAFSIARHSKRISVRGPEGTRETSFREMNLRVLLGAQYFVAFVIGWITVAYRIPQIQPFARYVVLALTIVALPLAIYLSVRYGQGGSRLAAPLTTLGLANADEPEAELLPTGDRTSDDHWKLGQIYYNPDDAAIWVERRAGVGYTLNFARPQAWLILSATVAGPLLAITVMRG